MESVIGIGRGTDGGELFPAGREDLTGILESRPDQGRGVAEGRVTWSAWVSDGGSGGGSGGAQGKAQRRGLNILPKELAVTRGGVRAVSTLKLRLSRCLVPSG